MSCCPPVPSPLSSKYLNLSRNEPPRSKLRGIA